MPSRFNICDDAHIHRLLALLDVDLGPLPIRYNLAPTDQIPVIHQWEGQRLISDMRWWLVPNWCDGPSTTFPMFNARCETLEDSRAYQGCLRHKRCVIPAHSFIEFQQNNETTRPYLISAIDQALAFAGLWDYWSDGIEHILSCTIITTTASPALIPYNKRMPVMLTPENADYWLDAQQETDALKPLFASTPPYALQAVEINSQINNARNKLAPILAGDVVVLS